MVVQFIIGPVVGGLAIVAWLVHVRQAQRRQGLTLVHVIAQLEHIRNRSWVKMGYVGHKDSSR